VPLDLAENLTLKFQKTVPGPSEFAVYFASLRMLLQRASGVCHHDDPGS
jgi:hypothetical protein